MTRFLSIVVPVYQPDPAHLDEAVSSVLDQDDPDWELILVADGPQPAEVEALLDSYVDDRIIVAKRAEQGGIVVASNDAIERATGTFVTFLDNDDTLSTRAVGACRYTIGLHDDVDVVYTDEDKLDLQGRRVDPFHKPGWSPERLRTQMYTGHLSVYRRSLVEQVGRLRAEFNGSQDHDLALRVTEIARRVSHIPQILYHWRQSETSTALDPSAKDWAFEAGVRAVQDHLDRTGLDAIAERDQNRVGVIAVNPQLREFPLVSIIVLTGGHRRTASGVDFVLVENAVRSVVEDSTYPNYELIVVLDRNSTDELAERLLVLGQGRVRIVRDTKPFSFSGANNLAVSHAFGEHLVFLNDDTEVITPDWIERLVLWMSMDGVGAVGCCLEYPDGRIQHAGVFSRNGEPSHRYAGYAADASGAFGVLSLTSNCLAVTGACIGLKREKFDKVGGFSTIFPLNFNDVDLCLKLVHAGWRNVLDCRTRLVHFETSSRPNLVESWEHLAMLDRWTGLLHDDPWDNVNLWGYGVEETPSPPQLTELRERSGWAPDPRSWPLEITS